MCFAAHAEAATNRALGGIGAVNNGTLLGGDGTGTARFDLGVTDLGFVKQARDTSGNVLPSGANVHAGQVLDFVLYVDNPTPYAAEDVELTDLLTETDFTYVPGTLEQTSLPSGPNDAAIWAATWTPLSDVPGAPDDIASITDSGGPPGLDRLTVGGAPTQPNQAVTVPGMTLRAIRFRVRVN